LKSTTIKTWNLWVPASYGRMNFDSPILHHIKSGDLDCEVLFLALDKDEDVKKLLSLELTGAWINEAREVPKSILDALTGRVGRYPGVLQGGCTWAGILLDTNPPDAESWWYRFSEIETPKGWAFFKQPSGRSSRAENIPNLPASYYSRIMSGKDDDWIKVYVDGDYGFVTEGQPVFPMYRDSVHCGGTAIEVPPGMPVEIGADFGLTPAAVIGARLADGRWLIFDEVVMEDVGAIRFGETLAAYMAQNYADNPVAAGWGDPSGAFRAATDERTVLQILGQKTGWRWRPAPTNDPTLRLEVVRAALNRLVDGRPGIVISSKCPVLRKGFTGGYHRKFVKSGGSDRLHDTPHKNRYSHPHDALQYLLLGGGEANAVMDRQRRRERNSGPQVAHGVDFNVLDPHGAGHDEPVLRHSQGVGPHSARVRAFARTNSHRIVRDVDYDLFNE
jgi:hypothetical protein